MTTTQKTLLLDGYRLAYSLAGDPGAPPVILVHGWYSHRGVWRQTIPSLQDRYFCVAVDLLGFGDSDKPAEADYGTEAQGRRLLQAADALGLWWFSLVGHSMGGQIALCVSSMLARERVTRLVSVTGVTAARLMPRVERQVYRWSALCRAVPGLYSVSRWLSRFRWFAYSVFDSWFYEMDALPFDAWEVDRRMALQPKVGVPAYEAGRAIQALDLTPHLDRISAPTLALFGRQDGTVPVSDGHLVDRRVPDSHLVLFDCCGHFPMYEQTPHYLVALRAFLTG